MTEIDWLIVLGIAQILIIVAIIIVMTKNLIRRHRKPESDQTGFRVEEGRLIINNMINSTYPIDEIDHIEFFQRYPSRGCDPDYIIRIHRKNGKKSIGYNMGISVIGFDRTVSLARKWHIPFEYGRWYNR